MKKFKTCPFCGSENWEWMNNNDYINNYHCHECDRWFDEEDHEYEDLRHKISAVISAFYGDEEHPINFDHPIIVGEEEAQGLSSLQLPHVIGMFHDSEGIIWFNLQYCDEPLEFDKFSLKEITDIWGEVSTSFAII